MQKGINYYYTPSDFYRNETFQEVDEKHPRTARALLTLLMEDMSDTEFGFLKLTKPYLSTLCSTLCLKRSTVIECLLDCLKTGVLRASFDQNWIKKGLDKNFFGIIHSWKSYQIINIDFFITNPTLSKQFCDLFPLLITTDNIQGSFNAVANRREINKKYYERNTKSYPQAPTKTSFKTSENSLFTPTKPVDNSNFEGDFKTSEMAFSFKEKEKENFKRGEGREDPPYPPLLETSFQGMGEGEPSESIMSQSLKEPLPPKPDDLDKPTLEARNEVLLKTLGVTIPEGSNASPSPESSQRFGPSERRFIEQALATCEPKAHETEVDYWYNKVLEMLKNHPEREKIYIGENLSKKVLEMRYVDIFLDGKTYIPELKKFIKTQKKLPNSVINPPYFSNWSIQNSVSTHKNFNLDDKTKLEMNKPKPFIFETEEEKFRKLEELKRACEKFNIRPEHQSLAFKPILDSRISSGGFEVRERVAL